MPVEQMIVDTQWLTLVEVGTQQVEFDTQWQVLVVE